MKNKYALTIADIQLDVLSEAPRDEVDKIAGIVDRKMREIYLHSRSCTKNEAALLCALEFCSERLAGQGRLAELEELTAKYEQVLQVFRDKCQGLTDDLEKLRSENELLRALLTDKEKAGAATDPTDSAGTAEPPAPVKPVSAKEFLRQVTDGDEEPVKPAAAKAAPAKTPAESRSKTGAMFDLLSFDEV